MREPKLGVPENIARAALDPLRRHAAAEISRYAEQMIGLSSWPLIHDLFPNFKEVTESFTVFQAVRDHLSDISLQDPSVTVIAVGDGSTPRTAATFATRSKWRAVSIDPQLRRFTRAMQKIQRLACDPRRVEETLTICETAILVAVHSHAKLPASIASVRAKRLAVVALPCCVDLSIPGLAPDLQYDDYGCISPDRTVKIWRSVPCLEAA